MWEVGSLIMWEVVVTDHVGGEVKITCWRWRSLIKWEVEVTDQVGGRGQ